MSIKEIETLTIDTQMAKEKKREYDTMPTPVASFLALQEIGAHKFRSNIDTNWALSASKLTNIVFLT